MSKTGCLSLFVKSIAATVDGEDAALVIVGEFAYLQAAEPRLAAGGDTVVMEEIPLATVFNDAVVGGPAYDRSKDFTAIDEGSVGVVADGVAEQMAVTGGIGEIILAIVLMHPRSLEEAVRVICL